MYIFSSSKQNKGYSRYTVYPVIEARVAFFEEVISDFSIKQKTTRSIILKKKNSEIHLKPHVLSLPMISLKIRLPELALEKVTYLTYSSIYGFGTVG